MEKALNFLLQNWLMVGLEVLIFFGIGLLFAKLIWGRYNQRLYTAIEENMNLASQWQALGGSQRDLFKKLRNRWQEDRDGFDSQLEKFVVQLASRDKKIKALEEGQNKNTDSESLRSKAAENRVTELEDLLEKRDEEISGLNHSLDLRAETDEVRLLRSRVTDLEQDLVDAHDKLHELRSGKGSDSVIAEPESVRVRELESTVTDLKSKLESATDGGGSYRESVQLAALLKQRGRELKNLQSSDSKVSREIVPAVHSTTEAEPKVDELTEKVTALQDELDSQVDDHSEALQGLYQQISDLELELQNREDEIATLGKSDTIGNLLAQSGAVDDAPKESETTIVPLMAAMSPPSEGFGDGDSDELLAEKDRVIERLKAELKDALDEMTDVREGYNQTFGGVEVLEARLAEEEGAKSALESNAIAPEELEEANSEIGRLTEEVESTANELSQFRRREAEQKSELTDLGNQIEELEAIVDDRNAEVSDAVKELESQRELIRNLRVKVAEQEGDLEGMTEGHSSMSSELLEKASIAEMLTGRIAEVELALSNRYGEMNRISTQLEIATGTLNRSSSHSQEVSKELDDLKWDNGIMSKQIADLETELTESKDEVKKMTADMEEMSSDVEGRRQKMLVLEDRYNLMKTEATEKSEALELAKSELEAAREQLETIETGSEDLTTKVQELEQMNLTMARDLDLLRGEALSSEETQSMQEQSIATLKMEVETAETENDELKSQLAAAQHSQETLETNSTHLAEVLDVKTQQLGDFSDRINRLIHGDFQSFGGNDSDDGGSQPSMSDFFASEDDQINALGDSIALLEARAVDAEQNFGSCENELVVLREEIIEIKQAHQIELLSQTESIELLQDEIAATAEPLEAAEAKLQSAQGEKDTAIEDLNRALEELQSAQQELESGRAAHHQHEHQEESASHLKELVETLRNDLSFKQMAIRELEDQLTYERQRENFQESEASVEGEESPHSINRVKSAIAPHFEDSGNGSLRVFFDDTKVNLNGEALIEIDRAAREVRSAGGRIKISVLGYSGAEGSEAMNESLSARRAEAVRERLMENGVSHSLISVQSGGEDESFGQSEDSWRARRVEVNLIAEAVAETVN